MSRNEPVDPAVRFAISRWPDDAPRGAVNIFCVEHGISRKTFYPLRARALTDGATAVLEPRSRRPRSSPSTPSEEVMDQAVQVRPALETSGLDHGPISVHERVETMGLATPSVASLAWIFRGPGGAAEETSRGLATVRLSSTERVLAAGRDAVRPHLRPDLCDLPAPGRSFTSGLWDCVRVSCGGKPCDPLRVKIVRVGGF